MMEREETIQFIIKQLEGQSPFVRKSIQWLVRHMEIAQWVCNAADPISQEVFQEELEKAIQAQDYAYYGLLLYQWEIQKQ